MSEWQVAHLRLLEQLPSRRHEWRPPRPAPVYQGRPPLSLTLQRRARIRELLAAKVPKRQMGSRIGISRVAVQQHLRAIAAEDAEKARRFTELDIEDALAAA